MTLLIKNLGRHINDSWIVRHLNLEVTDGECLALLGPSGCGKSSTLRLIAGLDKPNEGSIYLNNKNITNTAAIDRRIGMVFQSYALFPHLTVAENLTLGMKIRGISNLEQRQKLRSTLELFQIENLATRRPSQLSGGQKQRIALARAILRDPLVYLLDEPMSNLDAQLREQLRPELRRIILNQNLPVLYVTHDQHEAMAMSQKIAVLKEGILEQIGTPQELYHEPVSIFVATFIGRPQINVIYNSSKHITGIRPENIYFNSTGLKAKLLHKEWLGTNQLLFLDTPVGNIRITVDIGIEIPEDITINWDKKHEHHFDSQTGMRIINV